MSRTKTRTEFWEGFPGIPVTLRGFVNQTLIEHFLDAESSDQWGKTPGDSTGYLAAGTGLDLVTYYRPVGGTPFFNSRRLLILSSHGLPLAVRYVHPGENRRPDPEPFSGILSPHMFEADVSFPNSHREVNASTNSIINC